MLEVYLCLMEYGLRVLTEFFMICQAEAEAVSAVEEIVSNYVASVSEDSATACTELVASEAAIACAQAVAAAYTSVTTTVCAIVDVFCWSE